jgi:hypothetical protein
LPIRSSTAPWPDQIVSTTEFETPAVIAAATKKLASHPNGKVPLEKSDEADPDDRARPDLAASLGPMRTPGVGGRQRLERVLKVMLNEREFLSPYGIRSGMRLRLEQVQRLCGIEQPLCKLVASARRSREAKFLGQGSDGAYVLFEP